MIIEILRKVRSDGAEAIIKNALSRAEDSQARYNPYITLFNERAMERARQIDRLLNSGADPGPLMGLPVALKDNMLYEGERMTCASKILQNYISPYTATAAEKLEHAGAVIIGKTNMDEFAMGASGETSYFGATRNPRDPERVPGGSSSGSAAAVASGDISLALGSDTGGSIRQPAAFCGVCGLKPTYGTVSRYGLAAFASSLDQIGVFTPSVEDAAISLNIVSGYDPKDSTSINRSIPDYTKGLGDGVRGLRIGIPKEYMGEGLSEEIREVIRVTADKLSGAGAEIREVSLPLTKYGVATYYIIAPAEASANLARYDGVRYGFRAEEINSIEDMYIKSRSEGFGAEVKRRIMLGTYALSSGYYDAYYLKAHKVRNMISRDFRRVFKEVDLLLSPVTPTPPFKLGEIRDPLSMYLADVYTISSSLAGLPGMSVPAGGRDLNITAAAQIVGPAFSEELLLKCARSVEQLYE